MKCTQPIFLCKSCGLRVDQINDEGECPICAKLPPYLRWTPKLTR